MGWPTKTGFKDSHLAHVLLVPQLGWIKLHFFVDNSFVYFLIGQAVNLSFLGAGRKRKEAAILYHTAATFLL